MIQPEDIKVAANAIIASGLTQCGHLESVCRMCRRGAEEQAAIAAKVFNDEMKKRRDNFDFSCRAQAREWR